MTKEEVIGILGMIPLEVEGGMWRGMFRSDEIIPEGVFEGREGARAAYGSIFYLLTSESVSRMHRLATDELWSFYLGSPCEVLVLRPDGTGYTEILGQDIKNGEKLMTVVPRGCWQGVCMIGPSSENDWALLGTVMAPAYEDSDYEDGTEDLLGQYPEFADKILPLLASPQER